MTAEEKREALAKRDAVQLSYRECFEIFMNGCKGYTNYTDEEIDEMYAELIEGKEEE